MRTNRAQPTRRTLQAIALITLVGTACDKQSIGANESSDETETASAGTNDDVPDCGENFCADNPSGLDCIHRCEDDDSVDGCWNRCEPGETVDCWGSCENEDDGGGIPPFDSQPDVGDGSLEEDLLMVSEFGGQRFYISLAAERLGDTFQGEARSASLAAGSWSFGSSQPIDATGPVFNNEITFRLEDQLFEAGHHPFGQGPAVLDIEIFARLHSEEILCGSISVQGENLDTSSTVTITPFPWTAEDGSQVVMCP